MTHAPEPALLAAATDAIRRWLGGRAPHTAIVLGSGLGDYVEEVTGATRLAYAEIPGFPPPTVAGHAGALVAGSIGGHEVLLQAGRFHVYEGHDANTAVRAVRAFARLGVERLLLTNAAGGIRRTFRPGTLMLIADHINLTGRNPLVGPVLEGEGRFPDMSEPYCARLREAARAIARAAGVALDEGVYCGLLGPSYETPAEIRMLERLGADAVGMSTVLEVIAARARGVRCLGISTITNAAAGHTGEPLSHVEVMEVAARVRTQLATLLTGLVQVRAAG